MNRPSCIFSVWDLPGKKRPRHVAAEGIAAVVRSPGDAAGLTRMGVHIRTIEPGFAGTHRHFHTVEEEWSYVLSGRGTVRIGPLRIPVKAGHFVGFPPGPRPHHFIAAGEKPLILLEGGERRPKEDDGCYVDARKLWRKGAFVEPYEAPPPEQGDERQVVRWARVAAGDHSTAFRTHERTDEWVLILAGRARARIGDAELEIGPNDFIGHPAGGPPHVMTAMDELTYLMGGQVDSNDVVSYPEAGLRRVGRKLERAPASL